MNWQPWAWSAGTLIVGAAAGWLLSRGLFAVLAAGARRSGSVVESSLLERGRRPACLLLPLLVTLVALPAARLPAAVTAVVQRLLSLGLVAAIAWVIIASSLVFGDLLLARNRIDVQDNRVAREIETRIVVLQRVLVVVVGTVALAMMLLSFPTVQRLGASLLASAGLAGLVAGIAARPVLTNLLAGLQIAVTQPIRIEDVVIVEGEWGWIEEITSTYVVVRIWDLRRLVLPLSYFIEHPFQNWTRRTADLLGTVYLYADYTVPVEEVRTELHRILQATDMWNGQTWGLQVTEADEHAVQLRCLMSASDSNVAWSLRCHVREELIAFLQQRHPDCLPRARLELASDAAAGTGHPSGAGG